MFARGLRNGPRVWFHPNGAKSGEMEFSNERQVGTRKQWSEAGELIGEEPSPGWNGFEAERARLLARFDSLHTHAKR